METTQCVLSMVSVLALLAASGGRAAAIALFRPERPNDARHASGGAVQQRAIRHLSHAANQRRRSSYQRPPRRRLRSLFHKLAEIGRLFASAARPWHPPASGTRPMHSPRSRKRDCCARYCRSTALPAMFAVLRRLRRPSADVRQPSRSIFPRQKNKQYPAGRSIVMSFRKF